MTYHEPWSPYLGSSGVILAVVLLLITGALVFAGTRLRHPLVPKRPGVFLGMCIVVCWFLAATTFVVAVVVYVEALIAQSGPLTGPANPITPITLISGVVAFFVIVFLTVPSISQPISPRQLWVAIGSGVVGAIAAPMIFELPYDLIVLWHTHPPSPAALFTLLFFLPLFLIELLSFAMLTFSPFTNLSRTTLFLLAGMFFIFAVWAVFGFAYPSDAIPFACNAISKVLAFAVAISLFLPHKKVAI